MPDKHQTLTIMALAPQSGAGSMLAAETILQRCALMKLPTDLNGCAAILALEDLRYSDWMLLNKFSGMQQRTRAERFRFQGSRQAFVAAHSLLRLLVSHLLNKLPDQIDISCIEGERPALLSPAEVGLHMSMTHSSQCVGAVVCIGARCGIDLEHIPTLDDHETTARQTRHFLESWCAGEARFKAVGERPRLRSAINEEKILSRRTIWRGHEVAVSIQIAEPVNASCASCG